MKTFNKAMQCLQNGDFNQGRILLLKVLEEAPGHLDAMYNLGLVYNETGDLDLSIDTMKQCLEINPQYTNAWVALGYSLYGKKQYVQATEALEQALRLEPNNVFALMNLGGVLAFQGRLEDAAQMMERAYLLVPEDPAILHGLAKLYEDLGDLDNALKYLELLEKIPNLAERAAVAKKRIKMKKEQIKPETVNFIAEALQVFAAQPTDLIQRVINEIMELGQKRINLGAAEEYYELPSLPGQFIGLQLLCYLYVGTKHIGGDAKSVADLAIEYHEALKVHREKH